MTVTDEVVFWDLIDELREDDPRTALVDFTGSGLVVKLPADRVAELIAAGHGEHFAPAGKVFEEWVAIPRRDRRRWRALLGEGVAFVGP